MLFTRFTRDARRAAEQAQAEARRAGSPTIEAEHLLLAVAGLGAPPASLTATGLDHAAVQHALDQQRDAALAAVGVSVDDYDLPGPNGGASASAPRFATSAKTALAASLTAADERRDRRIRAPHLVLGILAAERGTVPRALEAVGVDRPALGVAVRRELDGLGR